MESLQSECASLLAENNSGSGLSNPEVVLGIVQLYSQMGGDIADISGAPAEIRPFLSAAHALAEEMAARDPRMAAPPGPGGKVPGSGAQGSSGGGLGPSLDGVRGASLASAASAANTRNGAGLREGIDYEHITVNPGFVLKTQDTASQAKTFVNICSHANVAKVGDWANGVPDDVQRAMDDAGEDAGVPVRIPLSLDGPRHDVDKTNAPCVVWDCCFHTDVVKQAMGPDQRRVKMFLCQVAINAIAQRSGGATLDERFKFPKMAYKGNPENTPHTIRKDPKKVVHEVREVFDESDVTTPLAARKKEKPQLPSRLANAPRVAVTVGPGAKTVSAEVRWQASSEKDAATAPTISVCAGMCSVTRNGQTTTLPLGLCVNADGASASWDGRSTLKVTLQTIAYADVKESLAAHAAAKQFGSLNLRTDALALA
mmetsp:Transcript_3478/g.8868  ORF Transcript_3478/g.8868 Transcript_3478/m.8868 type:complete len:428 (-) Transcript_3478:123-1406(-)|eukprot:CAMPEP_0119198734 /NCGR_PEP_ID=MMETSP1316-20130426/20262_1 /TAXON_ID=41880 /ORGANISM="Pycnococcus provasolii, Strain RCC2336" /LENGTH=427 /DNA_ID=CAMNT_0007194693 /DNA_START=33 /DNA_END=1316 /DNA_ORIENTATION=+